MTGSRPALNSEYALIRDMRLITREYGIPVYAYRQKKTHTHTHTHTHTQPPLLTCHSVGDLSCIVQQSELVPVDGLAGLIVQHLMRDEVLVLANGCHELLQEGGVANVPGAQTLLVQHGDDSLVLLLHKVTDDLVVKILHRLPLKKQTNNVKVILLTGEFLLLRTSCCM